MGCDCWDPDDASPIIKPTIPTHTTINQNNSRVLHHDGTEEEGAVSARADMGAIAGCPLADCMGTPAGGIPDALCT